MIARGAGAWWQSQALQTKTRLLVCSDIIRSLLLVSVDDSKGNRSMAADEEAAHYPMSRAPTLHSIRRPDYLCVLGDAIQSLIWVIARELQPYSMINHSYYYT